MNTLIGYARVSTHDQDLDEQLERLEAEGCTKLFSGKRSGKSDTNKEQLEALVDYVRDGDTVIVTKLDRLGRSLSQVLQTVDKLTAKQVNIRCLDQPIDTSKQDAMSKAMVQLLGMFAEMEHSMIVERTQGGRIRSGKLGGRPTKLDDKTRQIIAQKLSEGASKNSLSKEFEVSRATIMRIGLSGQ